MTVQETMIAWDALPVAVTAYLASHQARDAAALVTFADDASVTDEGHVHRGRAEIAAWLADAGREFTYTTEFVGAARVGSSDYDVRQRLEGDFPGGVADLHYRFTLAGGLIGRLVIEP
ncbi:nuclear transport factor 2 family protein [Mycolicibacterium austroafricanum]|uniref:nuclear transport factor 2 family protein n=1 Tax=Mycolicibacterium austroafricanum TaxID=39687 RepID=UPI001CA37D58|nr:nuclear transport factor 2 family protein [Mycolicibacterium austroafricanum]QZT65278.1 nuclear transport factor 2 family protein [Mycolicibacterium austroafricanum]